MVCSKQATHKSSLDTSKAKDKEFQVYSWVLAKDTEHLKELVFPSTDGKERTDVSVTTSSNTSDPVTEVSHNLPDEAATFVDSSSEQVPSPDQSNSPIKERRYLTTTQASRPSDLLLTHD